MRTQPLTAGITAILLAGLGASLPAASQEKPSFFNGKDLSGWRGLLQYWKVVDGAIVGSTEPTGLKFNTFLCSEREYGDFELSFQVRLKNGRGNSGVQIRSEILDKEKFVVRGPQCDIGQQYWGSLYGEHFGGMMQAAPKDLVAKAVKPTEFNDYSIRCVGKRVTIKINGVTTVDGEFPKMPDKGIIAWQLHSGDAMEVTFKNISFHEISSAK
ncbi:MAG: DUF1080 domain-containing protein [Gemmatales bacterium]|nr:DUF1080 domain-containing protein [Gemmatales bacterium]MCS7161517.1 DUF1080 domain-containing protein [Gemmatales bacterium]MDW8176720.1 DUF1080 domain-containing protein [Gemmatales bacterium]